MLPRYLLSLCTVVTLPVYVQMFWLGECDKLGYTQCGNKCCKDNEYCDESVCRRPEECSQTGIGECNGSYQKCCWFYDSGTAGCCPIDQLCGMRTCQVPKTKDDINTMLEQLKNSTQNNGALPSFMRTDKPTSTTTRKFIPYGDDYLMNLKFPTFKPVPKYDTHFDDGDYTSSNNYGNSEDGGSYSSGHGAYYAAGGGVGGTGFIFICCCRICFVRRRRPRTAAPIALVTAHITLPAVALAAQASSLSAAVGSASYADDDKSEDGGSYSSGHGAYYTAGGGVGGTGFIFICCCRVCFVRRRRRGVVQRGVLVANPATQTRTANGAPARRTVPLTGRQSLALARNAQGARPNGQAVRPNGQAVRPNGQGARPNGQGARPAGSQAETTSNRPGRLIAIVCVATRRVFNGSGSPPPSAMPEPPPYSETAAEAGSGQGQGQGSVGRGSEPPPPYAEVGGAEGPGGGGLGSNQDQPPAYSDFRVESERKQLCEEAE